MQKKQVSIIPKSMQQDLAVSQFPNDAAFEIRNMRIVTTGDNTSLCLVNEKSNSKELEFQQNIVVIGFQIVNNYVILFVKESDTSDAIYRLKPSDGKLIIDVVLYRGNLGFSVNYPIESTVMCESDSVWKIYWVDGKNPLRFINILEKNVTNIEVIPTSSIPNVTIKKVYNLSQFPSGVIQYIITKYNKNGAETPILYYSPLEYLDKNKHGASPEETSNVNFEITITDADKSFDYFRIYSIIRTTENQTVCKVIKDIEITDSNSYTIIDSNTSGFDFDFNYLLYLDRESVIPSTLEQKDNHLFIGNLKYSNLLEDLLPIQEKLAQNSIISFNPDSEGIILNKSIPDSLFNNDSIKGLKSRGIYYFGLQLRDAFNVTSPILPIKKCIVDSFPKVESSDSSNIKLFPIRAKLTFSIESNRWKEARLMIIQHDFNTRNIIGQGIVSPTVYNVKDRMDNSPYAQASWIFRPAGKHNNLLDTNESSRGELQYLEADSETLHREELMKNIDKFIDVIKTFKLTYSRGAEPYTNIRFLVITIENKEIIGGKKEYSNQYIADKLESEEQCYNLLKESIYKDFPILKGKLLNSFPANKTVVTVEATSTQVQSADNINAIIKNDYYTDSNIITLNFPDIDSLSNSNIQNVSLYLVRDINFNREESAYKILSSSLKGTDSIGELKYNTGFLQSNILWNDNEEASTDVYATYMWHRKGSLNKDGKNTSDFTRKSELKTKIFLNSRIEEIPSNNFNTPLFLPIKDIKVFNYDQVQGVHLNTTFGDKVYYGNIDTIIANFISNYKVGEKDYKYEGYSIYGNSILGKTDPYTIIDYKNLNVKGLDPISIKYKSNPHIVISLQNNYILPSLGGSDKILNFISDGYIIKGIWKTEEDTKRLNLEVGDVVWRFQKEDDDEEGLIRGFFDKVTSITEKETFFVSMATNTNVIVKDISNNYIYTVVPPKDTFWGAPALKLISDANLNSPSLDTSTSGFYIADLEKHSILDDIDTSNNNLEQFNWIPISDFAPINQDNQNNIISNTGDTYFQRWDCLKTYPFTDEDPNQVLELASIWVESYTNIDGRYDTRRYKDVSIRNKNFNLLNSVYSQSNNTIPYRVLNTNFKDYIFNNQILFSSAKSPNSDIDPWTNINASNVLDLDGNKGKLNALRRINNEIYAFQDTGISRIIFNPRVQMNVSDGIPIEIANSGKVDGKVYVTDKYGCQNKWSIARTPSGLYFVDDLNQAIMNFNGQNIINLTYTKNMYSWINKNASSSIWNPKSKLAIRTLYDKNNNDIYFTTKDKALAFNERLGAFSSLYDYEGVDWVFSIENNTYQIKDNTIWKLHGGSDYSNFFGSEKPYSVSLIANPEFQSDKIFDTVEFRTNGVESFNNWKADSYPFNSLVTTNEY